MSKEINQYLLDVKFPEELKRIPKEELNKKERKIAEKIQNHEKIDDEEFQIIKKALGRWRKAISKYNINEISEAHNKTVEVIKTSNDLIKILDKDDYRRLTCQLPYFGKIFQMTFKVKPITDSRALQALSLDLDLFKDYNAYEKRLFAKSQSGQKLSLEEAKIVDKINNEINKNAEENQDELITKFLANQLILEDEREDNFEERLTFWKKFPLNQRISVFVEVERLLGLTEDDNFRLFPTS